MEPDSGFNGPLYGLPSVHAAADVSGLPRSQMVVKSSQLLSPDLSTGPSPSSLDIAHTRSFSESVEARMPQQDPEQNSPDGVQSPHHVLPLITCSGNDNLNVHPTPDSARTRSPIVTVVSYTRGDSPERDAIPSARQPSQSSIHLFPGCVDGSSSESEDNHPVHGNPVRRALDGSWLPSPTTGQTGIDPTLRGNVYLPSPNELEQQRLLEAKNADIRSWSASVSAANSETEDDIRPQRRKSRTGPRRRAKSTGDPSLQQDYFDFKSRFDDANIPGPNVLIDVSSDEEYGSETSESLPKSLDESMQENVPSTDFPAFGDGEPLHRQFSPGWDLSQDLPQRTLPENSKAAMIEYELRVKEFDGISRHATWGTRTLTDAEANSIVGGGSLQNLSISDDKSRKSERRGSIRRLLHTRHVSNIKRQLSDISLGQFSNDADNKDNDKGKRESISIRRPSIHRSISIGRSAKSPSMSTGSAVIAIARQMAAIGGRDSLQAASPSPPRNFHKVHGRRRSELPKASTPGLMELMASHGGPPVANIAYSMESEEIRREDLAKNVGDADADDEDDGEGKEEKGTVMEFPIPSRLPVPTLEGFKTQIAELNPRLQPSLIHRFAKEQVHRYKALVECKTNHTRAVNKSNCSSGQYCFKQGGAATLLPVRTSPQDPDAATSTQFHIPRNGETHDEDLTANEGVVAAAQFPHGVRLPPVKRLPAKFECPICFEVKKFQKPSDWTKHVHEDVLPFTCTFPHCNDPKSFKRKADWVRHENERHRKLEWWTCTVPDCNHTCYRKNNFVQHLVREHKMPEPKVKKSKVNASEMQEEEECKREREIKLFWEMVESCRNDTTKNPREEPCRFCGNVCGSWKKLSSHLAQHLAQIAMPIIALVEERDIAVNTESISPVDKQPGSRSGPESTAQWTQYPNGVSHEPDMKSSINQTHYLTNSRARSAGLAASSNATYPNPLQIQSDMTSARSGQMYAYGNLSQYGWTNLASPSGIEGYASQYIPMHQNSVTYPPPRPRMVPTQVGLSVLPESYAANLSASPTELNSVYDLRGSQQASPSTEGNHGQQNHMGQTMSYDTSWNTECYQGVMNVGNPQNLYSVDYTQGAGTGQQFY